MTRPLRIEFPGALYHVTARGNRRGAIYRDDQDRYLWLEALAATCGRFKFIVHAFCQMTDHYHLLLETADGGLAQGMRQLNSVYAQRFNLRHAMVGHLFQGRYKAILVQKNTHLLELARYVVLNPVRAGMVASPGEWPWSSYALMTQAAAAPAWLDTAALLALFGPDARAAGLAYREFVAAGLQRPSPLKEVRYQLLLGDDDFVDQHIDELARPKLDNVTRIQRRLVRQSLAQFAAAFPERDEAMAHAYSSTAHSMREIARHFAVSPRTVGRAVKRHAR
jgi:putative transposase